MTDTRRAALVVGLFAFGALADACRHHSLATPDPPHAIQWILPPRADEADLFCVPSPFGTTLHPSDAYPLRCTTIGDIRRYVRAQRWTE